MGALDRLPTLAEVQADRASRPNWKSTVTRLDEKTAADTDDAKKLRAWSKAVRHRDRGMCRVCGIRTTEALDATHGEAHHVVSRTCPAVRHDVRNGLWCCKKCHGRFKGRGVRLFVIGTAAQMFQTARGHWYLDATCDLKFEEKTSC